MKLVLLILALIFTGCATKLPVQVRGLEAAEMKPNNCLQCAQLVEQAVKQAGGRAQWVSLPPTVHRPGSYHAICVLEHGENVYAYDSHFDGMIALALKPAEVFDSKGNFIGDPKEIHKRARPRDFHGSSSWAQLGLDTRGMF